MGKEFKDALKSARELKGADKDYYMPSYRDNIHGGRMDEKHIRMFCKGEGKELLPKDGKKEKGACIYSSSMLSYNFFSWIDKNHPLVLDGISYDKVVFEEQFRVLATRNNRANLDVVLVSEDGGTVRLFESKFTEQLDVKASLSSISDAYYDSGSYFEYEGVENWAKVFKEDLKGMVDGSSSRYYDGLKQVACHLVGISSMIRNAKARKWFNDNSWLAYALDLPALTGEENYIFQSIVFCPNTEEEKKRTEDYLKLNKVFVEEIKRLPDILPDNLSVDKPIITYRDLWNSGMEKSVEDPALKAYLEKYLKVHI